MSKQLPPTQQFIENESKKGTKSLSIDSLYAARKQRHLAPLGDKKSIIDKASKPIQASLWENLIASLQAHAKSSAIYASIAIAAVIIGFQTIPNTPIYSQGSSSQHLTSINNGANSQATVVYTNVQIHSLESETARYNSSELNANSARFLYTKATEDMQKQQSLMSAHRELFRVVNQDSTLQLVNCQNELIEVSSEALAFLVNKQVDLDLPTATDQVITFDKGQLLAVSFDTNGYIMKIGSSKEIEQCS